MNLGQIPVMPSDLRGRRVFWSRQTLALGPLWCRAGNADAALLFWEVDSSKEGVNGGGGGSVTSQNKVITVSLKKPRNRMKKTSRGFKRHYRWHWVCIHSVSNKATVQSKSNCKNSNCTLKLWSQCCDKSRVNTRL